MEPALISGLFAILAVLISYFVQRYREKDQNKHEIDLERIRATFDTKLEDHKCRLNEDLQKLAASLEVAAERDMASIEIQKNVRNHMTRTREYLNRVHVSFSRLSKLAVTIEEHDVLPETTNTLDLYAEYRQHLAGAEYVSYPDKLKECLDMLQNQLATIFLDLRVDEESRKSQEVAQRMSEHVSKLDSYKESAVGQIEHAIRVRLDPLQ